MFRLGLLFIAALVLIDAALLGNIGAILGSVIDPANMVETGAGSTTSPGSTGGTGLTPTPPGTKPKITKSPTNTPGYYPPGTTIPQNV